ncbi:MAG: bifunctional 2-C-methyl-D-erythritol 4-phosphate cytidylyltransferase/2-C-methyl-D-erythritol 2,4-cyclodiphosphate synthase [Rhodobacteraceae bacterium]|nr:bifunctional 2-C-methyl-D-erythritol 4-phosphate cytidylyltransferase/2-C-methyl-D-erythritol 2,4-cyclodiphosphate synthase [Paracoccaceae bacterium]
MDVAIIIVAAGRGSRADGELAKQWRDLAGMRVLDRTVARFASFGQLCIILHPDDMDLGADYAQQGHRLVAGGASRCASVLAGLEALSETPPDLVLIHDGARATVPESVITGVLNALQTAQGAAPALPVTDALWRGDQRVTGMQDRAGLWRAQTPQGFDYAAILSAFRKHDLDASDDVEVARAAGIDVVITQGHEDNIKITYPDDFDRARQIIGAQQKGSDMDIRCGNGFDVHRFGTGDHVMLCGIRLEHGRGLQGHSDADVGMHALTDAIYGALVEGDIGRHFPPSDPQWKGAASEIFLAHAAALVREKGFVMTHADVTLICEQPKIGPHAQAMQAELCRITGVELGRISVKATTSERLGFTGREEGIAAMATATLVKV